MTPPALFTAETFRFLEELEANNERAWFAANKPRYEEHVLEPALRFIERMQEPLARIAPHFTAIPARSGGSLMRVYRDTRFSRDKTPYKTNVGIQFRHEEGRDVHAPGYYLHLDPHRVFIAAGLWRPSSAALAAIRAALDARPGAWRRVRDEPAFQRCYTLGGDTLTRAPGG